METNTGTFTIDPVPTSESVETPGSGTRSCTCYTEEVEAQLTLVKLDDARP
jgi:hypothetical protein